MRSTHQGHGYAFNFIYDSPSVFKRGAAYIFGFDDMTE